MSDLGDGFDDGFSELHEAVGPVSDGFTATDVVQRARQRERRRAGLQAGGAVAMVLMVLGGAFWAIGSDDDGGGVAAGPATTDIGPTSGPSADSTSGSGPSVVDTPSTSAPTSTSGPVQGACDRRVAVADGCEVVGVEVAGEPLSLSEANGLAAQYGGELIAMRTAALYCVQINEPILGRPPGAFESTDFVYNDATTVYDRRARLGPPVTVGGGSPWEVDLKMWEFAQTDGVGFVALALYVPVGSDIAESDRVARVAPVDWIRSEVTEGDSETEGEIFLQGDLSEFGEPAAQSGCTAEGPVPGDLVGTPDPNPVTPWTDCVTEFNGDLDLLEPYFAAGEVEVDLDGDGAADAILVSTFSGNEPRTLWISLSSQPGNLLIGLELPEAIASSAFSLLGAVDTDGAPGDDLVLLDEGGNTAQSGVVLSVRGCDLAIVELADGAVFSYLHDASGNGCVPGGCPVSVECIVEESQTMVLEVGIGNPTQESQRLAMEDESGTGPAWTDPTMEWSREAWRIEGGIATELIASERSERAVSGNATLDELAELVVDGVACDEDGNVVAEASPGESPTTSAAPEPPAGEAPDSSGEPVALAPARGAGPATTIPGDPRPLVIESRSITDADRERLNDDDGSEPLDCTNGVGQGSWDYGPIPPDAVGTDTAPSVLLEYVMSTNEELGFEALPTSGWIELIDGDDWSTFVAGGSEWTASLLVTGVGERGIWRPQKSLSCQP